MWKIYTALGILWVALMPPLFTNGACTAEFEAIYASLNDDKSKIKNTKAVTDYINSQKIDATTISAEQCREAKPRFLARCESGDLYYLRIPISNKICRIYRDDSVKVQLQYNEKGQLSRMVFDMAPFKFVEIPYFKQRIYWAK